MKRVALAIAAIIVIGLLVYVGSFYLLRPTADGVLDGMARAYAEAEDYSQRTTVTHQQTFGGRQSETEAEGMLLFKRPNKLRQETAGGESGKQIVASDGTSVYSCREALQECAMGKAPAKVSELEERRQEAEMLGEGVDVLSLLDGVDIKGTIASVSLEPERLFRPQKTHVLTVTFKDGGTQKLWVGKKDLLIRKSEWHPSMEGMLELVPEEFRDTKLAIVETFAEARINGGIEDEQFVYTPPEGVTVTEEVNLSGKPAPDLGLVDLTGRPLKLSELRGTPVLLDFWATWCPPCLMELPHIQEIHETHGPRGLRIVAISRDESKEAPAAYAQQNKLTFTVVWVDPVSAAGKAIDEGYKVNAIPRLILIDKDGVIRADLTGYHPKKRLTQELSKVGL